MVSRANHLAGAARIIDIVGTQADRVLHAHCVGRAAVRADVVDRRVGALDPELRAEQPGDGLSFRFARSEVGARGAIGREVQQQVRGLVDERGEFNVRGLAHTAGDATTVGVAEQAGRERLVLEIDVVADQEGLAPFEEVIRGAAPRWLASSRSTTQPLRSPASNSSTAFARTKSRLGVVAVAARGKPNGRWHSHVREVRNTKLRASDLGMHQNRYSQHEKYVTPGLGCRWMTHGRPGLLGARVRTDVDAVPVVIATAARLHAEGWSPRGERNEAGGVVRAQRAEAKA